MTDVTEAMALLCDMETGKADKRGHYPNGSLLGLASARLSALKAKDKA
ncbi:hypothetical protein [Shewanella algae]|nr:hypothetical protein [Shewanella algae]MBO2671546.1 hypothetical protein [Shewanella algae]